MFTQQCNVSFIVTLFHSCYIYVSLTVPEGNMNVRGKCHLNQSKHVETINLMFTSRLSWEQGGGLYSLCWRSTFQDVAETTAENFQSAPLSDHPADIAICDTSGFETSLQPLLAKINTMLTMLRNRLCKIFSHSCVAGECLRVIASLRNTSLTAVAINSTIQSLAVQSGATCEHYRHSLKCRHCIT